MINNLVKESLDGKKIMTIFAIRDDIGRRRWRIGEATGYQIELIKLKCRATAMDDTFTQSCNLTLNKMTMHNLTILRDIHVRIWTWFTISYSYKITIVA